jgi:rubredoxin
MPSRKTSRFMAVANSSFTIYATDSRISKGLLAIPRRKSSEFPATKGKILVVFDDGTRVEPKIYVPYNPKIKECRVFGLSRWFSRHGIVAGDAITITVEDPVKGIYRIALDRFVQQRRAAEARRQLYKADSPEIAGEQLRRLAESRKEKVQEIAFQEIALIAQRPLLKRKRVTAIQRGRAEAVPPALRALLEALHQGKCQVCDFTFKKRDGQPYFEIHHLEPDEGHHPMNVLVICPNCHAQLENATVTEMERVVGWLVAVRINGRRFRVRQPFVRRRLPDVVAVLAALCIAARVAASAKGV